jgi:hypothetical protein
MPDFRLLNPSPLTVGCWLSAVGSYFPKPEARSRFPVTATKLLITAAKQPDGTDLLPRPDRRNRPDRRERLDFFPKPCLPYQPATAAKLLTTSAKRLQDLTPLPLPMMLFQLPDVPGRDGVNPTSCLQTTINLWSFTLRGLRCSG